MIIIGDDHRFETVRNSIDAQHKIHMQEHVERLVKGLSPSRKRMLKAVMRAMHMESDSFMGHVFQDSVNRARIVDELKRKRLVPWDVKILRELVRKGLVKEYRQALPKKRWQARGYEYRYTIDSDTLWCLVFLSSKRQEKKPAVSRMRHPSGGIRQINRTVQRRAQTPSRSMRRVFQRILAGLRSE